MRLHHRHIDGVALRTCIRHVSIMMLIRNHLKFVESTFAQFVKGGMFKVHIGNFFNKTSGDISSYIEFFKKNNDFDFFCYSHFVEMYKEVAPNNNIELLSIEKEDNDGKDIVNILCARFGLNAPEENGVRKRINARYSEKSLLAMHYARKHFGGYDFLEKRRVIDKVFSLRGEGNSSIFSLSGETCRYVKDIIRKDKEYFVSNGYNIPEKVFGNIDEFPREVDNITISEEEICAIKYLMENDDPDPDKASRLADNAMECLMDMWQEYESKIISLEKRLHEIERKKVSHWWKK